MRVGGQGGSGDLKMSDHVVKPPEKQLTSVSNVVTMITSSNKWAFGNVPRSGKPSSASP